MKKLLWLCSIVALSITACKKVKDEPQSKAVVATTAASAITANSVVTGGSITDDGGSPINQRGVAYADHIEPKLTDSVVNDASGSATWVSNLANLKPNTNYYARAYATNAQGTAYGNEVAFKTLPGLASITTAAITENVALSAKTGGEVVNDGGTPVSERGIVYAITPNPTLDNLKIEGGTGVGSFTATIPTASEETYYVRAYATNTAGTAYGEEISFKAISSNSVGDIDGNVYGTVVIGTQTWMTSNLKVTRFRNEDPITDGSQVGFTWHEGSADQGIWQAAFTYAERDKSNIPVYGLLYSLAAVRDSRGLCPSSWHVPSDDEWKTLEVFLGMSPADAELRNWRGTIGPMLMEGGSSGLNLQKGGYLFLLPNNELFLEVGISGNYFAGDSAFDPPFLYHYYRGVNVAGGPSVSVYRAYSVNIMSVRCIKD